MVLDLELFRSDKGADVDKIKLNQKNRFKDTDVVDTVVENDFKWRLGRYYEDKCNMLKNLCSKQISIHLKNKDGVSDEPKVLNANISLEEITPELVSSLNISQIKALVKMIDEKVKLNKVSTVAYEKTRDQALREIGNILHNSVPISDDENDNEVIYVSGEGDSITKPYSHVDLIHMIDGVDTTAGRVVAGGRGYYLKGPCVLLQTALVQMTLHKWYMKGYQPIYTPFFMGKDVMQKVAQLTQFEEELYKVVGKQTDIGGDSGNVINEEKFLIATSEQPLTALHMDQWIPEDSLPIRYIGQSTCFRQEVGAHGRDTTGIFRVHQFEKIEQFVLTSPLENKSWEMMEQMMDICKEFYEELGISYRIVNIVSGALNNSAAKKLDLEGWFPGSGAYRELVSCSNCLDYHSRRLKVRFGQTKKKESQTGYVHMLNCTACALTRVICILLETYQTDKGIKIPIALKKYFPENYPDVIPFVREFPICHKKNVNN